jgi:hypothetical protein
VTAELGGWPPVPAPVRGCVTCERLEYDRAHAQRTGDGAALSDANVLLRRHAAEQHQ